MKPYTLARPEDIKIIGMPFKTTRKNNQDMKDIPAFWEQFHSTGALQKIPNKVDDKHFFGVYTDYADREHGEYTLIIGTRVFHYDMLTLPKGMVFKIIPSDHYAVFSGKGPKETVVVDLWKTVWHAKELQRTFTYDFEWYHDHDSKTGHVEVEIYVAIK